MFEVFYLFNSRYLLAPVLNRQGLFGSRAILISVVVVIAFQLLFTYAPPLQHLFATRPIGLDAWGRILGVTVWVLVLIELEKWVVRTYLARG